MKALTLDRITEIESAAAQATSGVQYGHDMQHTDRKLVGMVVRKNERRHLLTCYNSFLFRNSLFRVIRCLKGGQDICFFPTPFFLPYFTFVLNVIVLVPCMIRIVHLFSAYLEYVTDQKNKTQ